MTYEKYPEGKLMLPYAKKRFKNKLVVKIHGTGLRDLELINVKIKQLYEYIDKVVKVDGE